jgi:hypothetical protein
VSFSSSTSTKEAVRGCSVGGRESQTRGVTLSAPNSTVLLIGTSRCEIRPVTLSRAAKTAIGFLMTSAEATLGARQAASTATSDARGSRATGRRAFPIPARSTMKHTS